MIYSNLNSNPFVKASEHEDKDPKAFTRKEGFLKIPRRRTPSTLSVPETESVQLGSAASPNPSSVRRRLLRKPLGSRDLTQVGLPALGPSIPSDDLVYTFTDISWRADEGSRP